MKAMRYLSESLVAEFVFTVDDPKLREDACRVLEGTCRLLTAHLEMPKEHAERGLANLTEHLKKAATEAMELADDITNPPLKN